jgi:hypothetical protein
MHQIYAGISWSSSLKRIMPSGSVLLLPETNPHLTLMADTLATNCPDCYLTYKYPKDSNVRHLESHELSLCDEIIGKVFVNANDTFFSHMADKLARFLEVNFSLDQTLAYMREALAKISLSQNKEEVARLIQERRLVKYSCEMLRRDHLGYLIADKGVGFQWMYDEWYNSSTCKMNEDSTYLRYFPA